MAFRLDKIDKEILNILQVDAKLKTADIADQIGVPPSTVFGRVKRLEREKIILGYKAVVDPKKVGKGFVSFLFGEPQYSPDLNWDKIAEKLTKIKGVQEVYFVSGQDDFLLKVRARNAEEYSDIAEETAKILNKNAHGMIIPKVVIENTVYKL